MHKSRLDSGPNDDATPKPIYKQTLFINDYLYLNIALQLAQQ
jgi:hypothetical protein